MKDYNKALFYIAGNRRGWVFSPSDIMNNFSRREADDQIKYLLKKGKIRRIDRGLYEYPRYSNFLKQELSPDMDMAVRALERKFNWRTEVSGETALNMLGLSTQVPGRYIYLSDGPSRTYNILGTTLEFRKTVLKDIGFKYKESSWIVQSLKALGKDHVNERVIKTIKNRIDPKMCDKILRDTKYTKNWIYEYIKEICMEDEWIR